MPKRPGAWKLNSPSTLDDSKDQHFITIIILVIVVVVVDTIAIPEVWKPVGQHWVFLLSTLQQRPSTLQRCASPITTGNLD